jgi:hypothetical protein
MWVRISCPPVCLQHGLLSDDGAHEEVDWARSRRGQHMHVRWTSHKCTYTARLWQQQVAACHRWPLPQLGM